MTRKDPTLRRMVAVTAAVLGLVACRSRPLAGDTAASAAPAATSVPVDRLAPGELAPSEKSLFGLSLPRGMRIDGAYGDVAYARGRLPQEDVANYIRKRVSVSHVELGVGRTVFPRARIPGQPADHVHRIEVFAQGPTTRVIIRRFAPTPVEPGLTEAERWRRAGYGPDGTLLDPRDRQ
jgi:hypothetical protein